MFFVHLLHLLKPTKNPLLFTKNTFVVLQNPRILQNPRSCSSSLSALFFKTHKKNKRILHCRCLKIYFIDAMQIIEFWIFFCRCLKIFKDFFYRCLMISWTSIQILKDVLRAIHLKSFDYRVLNLLLYQLRGEEVFPFVDYLGVKLFLWSFFVVGRTMT